MDRSVPSPSPSRLEGVDALGKVLHRTELSFLSFFSPSFLLFLLHSVKKTSRLSSQTLKNLNSCSWEVTGPIRDSPHPIPDLPAGNSQLRGQ